MDKKVIHTADGEDIDISKWKVIPIKTECIKRIYLETGVMGNDTRGWVNNYIALGTACSAVIEFTDDTYLHITNSEWGSLAFGKEVAQKAKL